MDMITEMGDDFRFQELGNVDQSAEKNDRDDILDETFSAGIWTVDSLNATKKRNSLEKV